jgi:hypothetical protein
MAIGKNFAEHGVWGVTPYEFTSTSSSPIWTLLVSAVFAATGPLDSAPFVLNLLAATAGLIIMSRLLRRFVHDVRVIVGTLVALVVLTSLPVLAFVGMEHTLHVFASLAFLALALSVLFDVNRGSQDEIWLCLLAFVLGGVRYESAFLIAAVVGVFLLRRRVVPALSIGALSALPVVVHGLISRANGWEFLPNSIWVKGTGTVGGLLVGMRSGGQGLGWSLQQWFYGGTQPWSVLPVLAGLAAMAVVYAALSRHGKAETVAERHMLGIVGFTVFAHMLFAGAGWFSRYEAYLLALVIMSLGLSLPHLLALRGGLPTRKRTSEAAKRWAAAGIAAIMIAVFVGGARAGRYVWFTPLATNNVYEQQYQMGQFLARYYPGSSVALNDIGATNYYADVRLLDLYSLGSMDVAEMWREGTLDTEGIRRLGQKHNIEIAIVYEEHFASRGGFPPEWPVVAQWGIERNVGAGSDIVSFIAVRPDSFPRLVKALTEYADELPPSALQAGAHMP